MHASHTVITTNVICPTSISMVSLWVQSIAPRRHRQRISHRTGRVLAWARRQRPSDRRLTRCTHRLLATGGVYTRGSIVMSASDSASDSTPPGCLLALSSSSACSVRDSVLGGPPIDAALFLSCLLPVAPSLVYLYRCRLMPASLIGATALE